MRYIAIQECSDGNESVGSMWLEAQSFEPETPIGEIVEWATSCRGSSGRLIITVERN